MRDLVIGMQALHHIAVPERDRFVQQRQHRGGHGGLGCGGGEHFPVAGAAVGENLPHDMPRNAAHVSLRIHQQLVEEAQQLLLAAARHIGVVFVKQPQIGADALGILLPARLLQQQVEGGVRADGIHQPDIVVKGQLAQGVQGVRLRKQRRIPFRRALHGAVIPHAAASQEGFKIMEFGINHLITPPLLRRHVCEFGEDDFIGVRQRADAHPLLSPFPAASHAEIGIDKQEGFNGQIFKFQIPG